MIYPVHEWKMTEEERLAYIKKHPIILGEKVSSFAELDNQVAAKGKSKKKTK